MGRAALVAALLLAAPASVSANEIVLDRGTVAPGEQFTVTLVLEGDAAAATRIPIPLENIELLGRPSVSNQYQFVNGTLTRRKVLEYTARALGEGEASIGPLRFASDGRMIEVPGVRLRVVAGPPGEADPSVALRALRAAEREPVVLVAQPDRDQAVVGEPIVVTWSLWARETLAGVSVTGLPTLADFWVEEMPVDRAREEQVFLDGERLLRTPVRRAALYPLRSGALVIPPMDVRVGMYRSTDPYGGWSMNSAVAHVMRSSAPLTLQVAPVPAEADVVGTFETRCPPPQRVAGGGVARRMALEGSGNLRGSGDPRLGGGGGWDATITAGAVAVTRSRSGVSMRREWTMLFLPQPGGANLPAASLVAWDPATKRLETLRCGPVAVPPARSEARGAAHSPVPGVERGADEAVRVDWSLPAMAALLLAAAGGGALVWGRRSRRRPLERRILEDRDEPRRMRETIRTILRERALDPELLLRAEGPLAETWRALSSLVDVFEKEPWERDRSARELDHRVRAFVRALGRA